MSEVAASAGLDRGTAFRLIQSMLDFGATRAPTGAVRLSATA